MGKQQDKVSEVERDPWAPAIPALQAGLGQLGGILDKPLQYFQGNTVAPLSGETNTALDMITQRAQLGNSGMRAGQNLINDTLQGKFLGGNPYRDQMIASATRPAIQQYTQNVLPSLSGSAVRSGRYGSDVYAQQRGNADRAFADSLTDMTGKLSYNDYAQERANQNAMLQLAPQYAQADYNDAAMMGRAGALRDQYAQQQINADMARHEFGQNEPYTRLARYFGLVNPVAGLGGTTTNTQFAPKADPWQQALGVGMMGASIFGDMMMPGMGSAMRGAGGKIGRAHV